MTETIFDAVAHYTALIGTEFAVEDTGQTLSLVSVRPGIRGAVPSDIPMSASLILEGPSTPVLEEQIYLLRADETVIDLFLSPVMTTKPGCQHYQAMRQTK